MAVEPAVEQVAQPAIALAHAHRDIEGERQPGTSPSAGSGAIASGWLLPRREIAGQRSPDHRDIDLAIGDGAHDIGRRAVVR